MKLRYFFFFFVIILLFSGCQNVWMEDVLQPKTITFETNGGSYVKPQTIYKYEKISQPQPPSRANHIFEGWYTDNISFTTLWNFENIPEKDMTLYAKWRTNSNNQPNNSQPDNNQPDNNQSDDNQPDNNQSDNNQSDNNQSDNNQSDNNQSNNSQPDNLFHNIDELEKYLQSLSPSNTPYDITLDPDNLKDIAKIINKYPDIFINLTLAGNNIDSISYFAFNKCDTLISVIIPDNIISIEGFSFASCSNLKNVTIGNGVTNININAFFECTSLTSITIPSGVTFIGECAFLNCNNLTTVTFEGKIYCNDVKNHSFPGNLRDVFYKTDANYGTPGTYIRQESASLIWKKQP